jgi:hypothetical protein
MKLMRADLGITHLLNTIDRGVRTMAKRRQTFERAARKRKAEQAKRAELRRGASASAPEPKQKARAAKPKE